MQLSSIHLWKGDTCHPSTYSMDATIIHPPMERRHLSSVHLWYGYNYHPSTYGMDTPVHLWCGCNYHPSTYGMDAIIILPPMEWIHLSSFHLWNGCTYHPPTYGAMDALIITYHPSTYRMDALIIHPPINWMHSSSSTHLWIGCIPPRRELFIFTSPISGQWPRAFYNIAKLNGATCPIGRR